MVAAHVTPIPWHKPRHKPRYGTDDTYRLAARWLRRCATVADWGGARGYLRQFLPESVNYTVIDGTAHADVPHVMADLAYYREPSEGICLRHVLDMTPAWEVVLANLLASFRSRAVIVTCWPEAERTHVGAMEAGWPCWYFNTDDVRSRIGDVLVADELVQTTHPERVYYLERRCAS